MRIYKIAEKYDNISLPEEFNIESGSCMLATEILVQKMLTSGYTNFKVIEGYITFPTVEWEETHTWIEMNNGDIIDLTKTQWGIDNIIYKNDRRQEYSPEDYLKLCKQYPVTNPEKYLR